MSEEKKFTHIAVTVDDDDDFVIEAGACAPCARPTSTTETNPAEKPAPAAQSEPSASAQRKPRDTYRETTLEDIESSKMPVAQKVVIALAVLGIIAFAVWYMLR